MDDMNTLWFVRFTPVHKSISGQVVFCLTATDADDAAERGRKRIADWALPEFRVDAVEPICRTPDVVDGFEPV